MVIKTKSELPIQLIRNEKNYKAWSLPSIDGSSANDFRQEEIVEGDDAEVVEEKTEELITAEALQAIKDQAYTEGFEKGRREGLDSAKSEIDNKNSLLKSMIKELAEPIQQCGIETQQQLLELSFAIARQIVRRELKQDTTQLIAIIRESLDLLPVGSKDIQILLHPEDASIVREVLSIDKSSSDSRWKLVEEPSMERGGCTIKTENSNIDASIDRQIAVLFSRLVGGQRSGERPSNTKKNTSSENSKVIPSTESNQAHQNEDSSNDLSNDISNQQPDD